VTTENASPPLCLSLWSLRHRMDTELRETLSLIGAWGFSQVEVAGFCDWKAADFAKELRHHKLRVCSLVAPPLKPGRGSSFYVTWAREYLELFETTTLILQCSTKDFPSGRRDRWMTRYQEVTSVLLEVADELSRSGVRVSYHCFPHDLAPFDGTCLVARVFSRDSIPSNCGLQLDTFWWNYAQAEPDVCRLLPVHSVHLNERDDNGHCCPLGTHDDRCVKFVRPLIRRQEPIDWILENDPSDEAAMHNDSLLPTTVKQCVSLWPQLWHSLAASPEDWPS